MLNTITVSEQVTNQLRNDIISGIYSAGEKITIKEVAEKYNVSAMPVREAFQYLNGEKLVTLLPYKGAIVLGISKDYVHDVFEMNALIQSEFAARASLIGITQEMQNRIEELYNEILMLNPGDDGFLEKDTEFHSLFLTNCNNRFAKELSDKYAQIMNYLSNKYKFINSLEHKMMVDSQHRKIIDFFLRGDADNVRKIIMEHRINVSNAIMKYLE